MLCLGSRFYWCLPSQGGYTQGVGCVPYIAGLGDAVDGERAAITAAVLQGLGGNNYHGTAVAWGGASSVVGPAIHSFL